MFSFLSKGLLQVLAGQEAAKDAVKILKTARSALITAIVLFGVMMVTSIIASAYYVVATWQMLS
jgi:hypothetical protein